MGVLSCLVLLSIIIPFQSFPPSPSSPSAPIPRHISFLPPFRPSLFSLSLSPSLSLSLSLSLSFSFCSFHFLSPPFCFYFIFYLAFFLLLPPSFTSSFLHHLPSPSTPNSSSSGILSCSNPLFGLDRYLSPFIRRRSILSSPIHSLPSHLSSLHLIIALISLFFFFTFFCLRLLLNLAIFFSCSPSLCQRHLVVGG